MCALLRVTDPGCSFTFVGGVVWGLRGEGDSLSKHIGYMLGCIITVKGPHTKGGESSAKTRVVFLAAAKKKALGGEAAKKHCAG